MPVCSSHVARGAGPLNTFNRDTGGVGGGARATEGGVCNCRHVPAGAPCCCLRKEGRHARKAESHISACIHMGLQCPRVRISAPSCCDRWLLYPDLFI